MDSFPGTPRVDDLLDSSGKRIRRGAVEIPRDQRELLDRPGSWISTLEREGRKHLNVPQKVLQQNRDCYIKHLLSKAGTQKEQQADENEAEDDEEDGAEDDDEANDAETPIPWSSSPPSNSPPSKTTPRGFATQLPPDTEPSARQHQRPRSASPAPPLDTQPPRSSPSPSEDDEGLTPALPAQNVVPPAQPRLQPILDTFKPNNVLPSSSLGTQTELEIVEPTAYTESACIGGIDPTPPSAQIQVPSTIDPNSSSLELHPKHAGPAIPKQRRMRQPDMSKLQKFMNSRSGTPAAIQNSRTGRTQVEASVISNSTSAVIPSTNTQTMVQGVPSPTPVSSMESHIEETPRRPPSRHTSDNLYSQSNTRLSGGNGKGKQTISQNAQSSKGALPAEPCTPSILGSLRQNKGLGLPDPFLSARRQSEAAGSSRNTPTSTCRELSSPSVPTASTGSSMAAFHTSSRATPESISRKRPRPSLGEGHAPSRKRVSTGSDSGASSTSYGPASSRNSFGKRAVSGDAKVPEVKSVGANAFLQRRKAKREELERIASSAMQ